METEKPLKIVIVTHNFYPHIGGLENVVYNQAKFLVKLGHKVVIISSQPKNSKKDEMMDGIKVRRIKSNYWFEEKWGVPYPIFSISELWTTLKDEIRNADIVHVHDVFYMSPLFGAIVSRLMKKPLILTEHIKNVNHSKAIVNFVQSFIFNTQGKFILDNSKKIIVCNEMVNNWLKREDKTVFLHNCVDKDCFVSVDNKTKKELRKKYNLPLEKPIVLFVGRMVECKNFDKLFEARDSQYLTVFIGPGNVPDYMKKDKDVKFLGSFPPEKIKEFYQLSDIFVLPSKSEGFPITILEAMSCGLPIIASDLPGYDAYLDRNKVRLIKPTPANIKNSINEILRNNKLRESMKSYSRNKIESNFNWEENVTKLSRVYYGVLNEINQSK